MKTLDGNLRAAFTLVELLVVIANLVIVSVIVAPAMAKNTSKSLATQCLYNHRQLALAWNLYAEDNSRRICRTAGLDSLVSVVSPSRNYLLNQWCMGTMQNAPSWTNKPLIMDSLLFKFVGDIDAYHCPADTSSIVDRKLSTHGGGGTPRARSISMNVWMNPINAWKTDTRAGAHPLKNFRFLSEVTKPALTFLTIDENAATINDGWFICDPAATNTWIDIPATYHDGSATLSFADGHSIMKKWHDPVLFESTVQISSTPKDNRTDLAWFQDRNTY
jgi:prepilin-type processing-associated H-X9-DG protein